MTRLFSIALLAGWCASVSAAEPKVENGEVKFTETDKAGGVPEFYRLENRTFAYELKPKYSLPNAGVDVFSLTFPSAVKTASAANNTVYAEYYKPRKPGKHPAVIVLDILDGAQVVSRAEALWLAQHDIPALTVFMAYYGPRREPGSKERLLSTDIEKSVGNVRQTVLDCRLAVAWLESRPEVDANKLGVLGTSLGSFVGGVFGGVEPKIHSVNLLLGAAWTYAALAKDKSVGSFFVDLLPSALVSIVAFGALTALRHSNAFASPIAWVIVAVVSGALLGMGNALASGRLRREAVRSLRAAALPSRPN